MKSARTPPGRTGGASYLRVVGDRGVEFEEYDFPELETIDGIADIEGERSAWFKDSEGNLVAVFQRTS